MTPAKAIRMILIGFEVDGRTGWSADAMLYFAGYASGVALGVDDHETYTRINQLSLACYSVALEMRRHAG